VGGDGGRPSKKKIKEHRTREQMSSLSRGESSGNLGALEPGVLTDEPEKKKEGVASSTTSVPKAKMGPLKEQENQSDRKRSTQNNNNWRDRYILGGRKIFGGGEATLKGGRRRWLCDTTKSYQKDPRKAEKSTRGPTVGQRLT